MDDLISRRAAIDTTWEEPSYTDPLNVLTEVRDRIKSLPSVQPEPKKGHWVQISDGFIDFMKCDLCGKLASDADNYCGGCGAKMER